MNHDVLPLAERHVRGTDTNSLLRLYDLANVMLSKSPSQQDRLRAGKAIQRISKELQKRNVSL
jgi:hypothetical protein